MECVYKSIFGLSFVGRFVCFNLGVSFIRGLSEATCNPEYSTDILALLCDLETGFSNNDMILCGRGVGKRGFFPFI